MGGKRGGDRGGVGGGMRVRVDGGGVRGEGAGAGRGWVHGLYTWTQAY